MFSGRLPRELAANAFSRAVAVRRAAGAPLLDLTETNPTAVGIPYPTGLLSSLGTDRALIYDPHPLGRVDARQAIVAEYAGRWPGASVGRVVLTASTSEAYGLLFKLLCDAGDEVLVPQPSYPLFDLLTRLDLVAPVPYALEYHGVWSIDRHSIERALSDRTRALLVVNPNNPTGSRLRAADREFLVELAAARGLALISDEVFADYPLQARPDAVSLAGEARALTFVLGGLSKSIGLPQVKLAWMLVSGPETLVVDAIGRLELIADTYLSVSTPVQLAAADLLVRGIEIRRAIHARVADNLSALQRLLQDVPAASLLPPEGGWSAVVRLPAMLPEETLVLHLLEHDGVIVHPGYFFDFPHEAFVVLSLLPEPAPFAEGAGRVLAAAAAGASMVPDDDRE